MEDSRDVAIEKVRIRRRIRRDLGDLTPLMNSLRKYGQLSPIVVTDSYELIAGHRRLESARRLGWTTIKATVAPIGSELEKTEIEMEENIQRRDLDPEEISDGFDQLDRLRNPGLLLRLWRALVRFFKSIFRK